jgi:hypothetical protein
MKSNPAIESAQVNAAFLLQETEWNIEADKRQSLEEAVVEQLGKVTKGLATITGIAK